MLHRLRVRCRDGLALMALAMACASAAAPAADAQATVGDVPKQFSVQAAEQDYARHEAMIPMRDGVRLYTVWFVPKGAKGAPMVMERTPYNVSIFESRIVSRPLFRAGYILVYQDVRGKYKSEGEYVVTRPVRGPLNSTATD
ncbi:MAG: CocE/NonD family hydrolase, partial [Gemmatimonadaceae bacterium]